jgi:hypothetical protein
MAALRWVANKADMQRLEQLQVRVLRRIVNVPCHVPDDVLKMELGCRSYARWMSQRKLEYAFKLRMMSPDRLPRRVAEAAWPTWPMPGGQCHERMHAGIVAAIEAKAHSGGCSCSGGKQNVLREIQDPRCPCSQCVHVT